MSALQKLHLGHPVKMGVYNGKQVPACYSQPEKEYRAARENMLLTDFSHLSIVSVMGDDAWSLVNHMTSADISIIRDEQGIYSLLLNEDGTIWGDVYVLCTSDGYYLLSENRNAAELIERLNYILDHYPQLDIQQRPVIHAMDTDSWGAIQLEGPYAWELLAENYGYDIIGLPYHEYMNTDDELLVFRCGKHGEFAYLLIGERQVLAESWQQLQAIGAKFDLVTGGLNYQQTARVENPCWDPAIYSDYSINPVELQMQWAIQYDKEDFIGKQGVEALSAGNVKSKLVGILPLSGCCAINIRDEVTVDGKVVGMVINSVYSPMLQSTIALALIDNEFACSDITGYHIATQQGEVAARTHNLPFIYNFSLLVNPTEHSYIDTAKEKSAL
ncbi:aminomethyltransferase family protein [Rahnella bruchi]|uniref:glycine cleavage T C-terminal barrel domain-containing protein n=1 Tax=Rahnella bruchi TaxID=1510573 RepID=UPI000EA0A07F|nr:aminomethyltransferase family protein [Rahnella bruchi]